MSGTITDVSGKTYNIEDVDKITWVDYKGDVLFESNYGDTVTYVQNGVEKTKTLTESRRLLKFMDGFVEGDYSYMPKTTADVVQAASLNMMTDSSLWLIAKGAVTLGGALIGSLAGNPLLGASIGTMVANLGADAYQFAESYGEDPNTFWSRYIENLKAVSTGVDSDQEAEATGFQRWMSELNTGMSYIGIGGKEAVYETWDDMIGATPDYVSANILGNLVRSIASSLTSAPGFSPTYVVDQLFNDGIREAARIEGITNDNVEAAKMGAVYGALSGVTAGFFAKLPLMQIPLVKRMDEVSPFLGSPIANGIEAASAQVAYDWIQNVADDTVPDKTAADVGINAGIAFGLGWAMSALPVMFSKLRPGQVALEAQAPSTGDQPTVKEVVENKIVVENAGTAVKGAEAPKAPEAPKAGKEEDFDYTAWGLDQSIHDLRVKMVTGQETGDLKFQIRSGGKDKIVTMLDWKKQKDREDILSGILAFRGEIEAEPKELPKTVTVEQVEDYKARRAAALEAKKAYRAEQVRKKQLTAELTAEGEREERWERYIAERRAEYEAERAKREKLAAEIRALKERSYSDIFSYENLRNYYRDARQVQEWDIMNALGYGALGDEFLITAQKQMKTDAIEAAYKGLRPNQRETFAKRMGYDSFDAFVESTPITELLDLNKEIVKIYDIPVYDPNVFAVSPQTRAEIKKEAVRLANSGVSPEIAVYLSFCKKTRYAPSQGQIQEIVSELPNKISMLGETKSKAEELIRFMDERGQAYLKDESLLEFKYPDNIDVTETVSAARTLEPLSPVKEKKTRAKRAEKK